MKLEQQVCSLELAKRLKELGVKQESYFSWLNQDPRSAHNCDTWYVEQTDMEHLIELPEYSAFTTAELGEMLPRKVHHYKLHITQEPYVWEIRYESVSYDAPYGNILNLVQDITEADARAKMLIYLLENKLITL